MSDREKKIALIQKTMSRKDLSFGCRVTHKIVGENYMEQHDYIVGKIVRHGDGCSDFNDESLNEVLFIKDDNQKILENIDNIKYEIIGHTVMIGDILDWYYKNFLIKKLKLDLDIQILEQRDEKRKSINDQSDECVDFIYSLIV